MDTYTTHQSVWLDISYPTIFFPEMLILNLFCRFHAVKRNYKSHKRENTSQCKILIVPEEDWFGQPKYITPSKKSFYVVSVSAFEFLRKGLQKYWANPGLARILISYL